MRRPTLIAVGAYVVGLVLFAAFVAVPFLTKKRNTPAEVPSPPALSTVDILNVRPGGRLCMSDLVVTRQSRDMRFIVGTYGKPGPALRTSIQAAGYRSSAQVPGGYPDNSPLRVQIPAPPRDLPARVCITNDGQRKVAFYATGHDAAHSRVRVLLDKRAQPLTPTFSFGEATPVSIAQRANLTARRVAVFRGFLDHAWIVWLLTFGMLVGVPLLAAAGLVLGDRQPRRDSSSE